MMKKFRTVLIAAFVSLAFWVAPAISEARGGHGGHGGGGHGGGHHGGGHHGGHHGGRGGNRGGFISYGAPGFGAGSFAGYWLNGYYYANPNNGVCERWVPTGGDHMESRQDPDTGAWYEVQVPDGYWEVVLCE